jgi:hypothetical protein
LDALLLHFLPAILEAKFGWHGVRLVAPEFPVPARTVRGASSDRLSDRVDALMYRAGPLEAWLLVEVKTDLETVDKDIAGQWEHRVKLASAHTMAYLERRIQRLDSQRERRYRLFRHELERCGFDPRKGEGTLEALMVLPAGGGAARQVGGSVLEFAELLDLELQTEKEAWRMVRELVLRPLSAAPSARRLGESLLG